MFRITLCAIAMFCGLLVSKSGPVYANKPSEIMPVMIQQQVGFSGGSGVVVDKRGFVLTAKHIGLHPQINVLLRDGRLLTAKLIYVGPEYDDVIGYMLPKGNYKYSRIAKTTPKIGDTVESWGYPANYAAGIGVREYKHVKGKIVDNIIWQQCRVNKVNVVCGRGWSGGPLYNSAGAVVGVLSAGSSTDTLWVTHRRLLLAYKAMDAYYRADKKIPHSPPLKAAMIQRPGLIGDHSNEILTRVLPVSLHRRNLCGIARISDVSDDRRNASDLIAAAARAGVC